MLPRISVTLVLTVSCSLCATSGAANDSPSESSTFNASNTARFLLLRPASANRTLVKQIDLEFRTSHTNSAGLFSIRNQNNETLEVVIATADQLKVRLFWLSDPDVHNRSCEYPLEVEKKLLNEELTLEAAGVGNGEWHRLTVHTDSNGSLVLDRNKTLGQLPSNFTACFAWSNMTSAIEIAGAGFQGCLSNVSLDESIPLPLHFQSELLNNTKHVTLESTSKLPDGAGCRQAPCPCEPNGVCIYRQWDLLDRCNCTRGYDASSQCKTEWDTCEHLETGKQCLNDGACFNKPGVDVFGCNCTQNYLGSLCQSFNICRSPLTCQNGAFCTLTGNVESPDSLNYNCTCTSGFTGKNCTVEEMSTGPDIVLIIGITVGVIIAILVLAIVTFVAAKVVRDRRRDSGAYRPSRREARADNGSDMAMSPAMRPPIDERLI